MLAQCGRDHRRQCQNHSHFFRSSLGWHLKTTESAGIFLPALTAHTNRTPEDVGRVDGPLDVKKARIVATPKSLLPVGFAYIALVARLVSFREVCERDTDLIKIAAGTWRQLSESLHIHIGQQVRLNLFRGLV